MVDGISVMASPGFQPARRGDNRAHGAFVPRVVDGSDTVEIAVAGQHIHIAKRRRTQQFCVQPIPRTVRLVTSIDVVPGDIGFRIDRPG